MKKRVLSAMRPTGALHLGHMAGALSNFVKLQNDENYECFYSIADWHALMSNYEESGNTGEFCYMALLDWLSVGLDPEKSPLFIQSHVPQHAELALALGMITPLGWLYRNPTYKEQIENIKNKDLSTFGFLGYPVLMAADILLYKASLVPVGEDQSAHLELSRETVRRFNNFFGENLLVEPQPLFTKTPKVPGIDGRKMSKSYGNALEISESEESMWQKLRTMITDPSRMRRKDPGDPEKCPVWDLHKVFNPDDDEKKEICEGCKTAGIGCIDCKKKLNSHIQEMMTPVRERRAKFEGKKSLLDEILADGAERASKVARETMSEIYPAMGLLINPKR
ncbi:MAG: tryptophan--tRNA ligase [Synergistaceae bacterium]|nr:tryptophan--tRNA ligase [Synergistaceae bacterium]MBQ6738739.1 tryptophan--tRNA ligase [Synergistaceae bacterium]MBQ7068303.1 tryptophan--tRNA ligase [Synergistaceae bacterium]MBR0074943.1 tryptophan--tRNA ligase [Synergistaceae bacterium]MBR0080356.1 tryptophan--tRNA ligase [Synergistaceae bacterium]